MLNTIKNLINSKKAYMESAELILENDELDDSIVLNEEPEEPEVEEPKDDETDADKNIENEDGIGAGGEPVEAPIETPAEPEEQPLPLPGTEELPTPAPAADDTADILTAEIDLANNVQTDILPVPPANASDAIVGDDFMTQTVDSGFGNDEEKPPVEDTVGVMAEPTDEPGPAEDDIMNASIEDEPEKKEEEPEEESGDIMSESIDSITESGDQIMTEAISLGDEAPADDAGAADATADAGTDATADASTEAPAEGGEEENPVTAAVKDKVDEITSEEQPVEGGSSKEELMKKLSSLTKSIEDAKNLVMSSIK